MIQSMTGFGRSSAGKGNEKITVSIKCINGKVLDLKIRGLDLEYSVEKSIRDFLSEKIIRGTIYINFELDFFKSLNGKYKMQINRNYWQWYSGCMFWTSTY